jgi:hypothetical protein
MINLASDKMFRIITFIPSTFFGKEQGILLPVANLGSIFQNNFIETLPVDIQPDKCCANILIFVLLRVRFFPGLEHGRKMLPGNRKFFLLKKIVWGSGVSLSLLSLLSLSF